MIHALAHRFAVGIKKAAPHHPSSVEVIRYSLEAILNAFFIFVLTLGIALFTGKVGQVALVLLGFGVLRQLSGGIHLKSGMVCVIVTPAVFTLFSFSDFNRPTLVAMTVIGMALAAVFAPSRIERQTRIPPRFFPLLKLGSVLLVGANLLIGSSALASAFLLQCLTLIRGRR
ncbi:accessory gene regulator ArgB-like protein [Cohnella sp. REN36]|uniref:accessory gene regulator ArgB-like protein n=1 Tax=Cohnella sp. REN36 TaxID=2887347 RepID=UPI001D151A33|nr:accessory gene regulator B family protein [Cohnella sp. REN36]MCC3374907.1 accessory gene regulator B family protein [Cohnella sp. REN36]